MIYIQQKKSSKKEASISLLNLQSHNETSAVPLPAFSSNCQLISGEEAARLLTVIG